MDIQTHNCPKCNGKLAINSNYCIHCDAILSEPYEKSDNSLQYEDIINEEFYTKCFINIIFALETNINKEIKSKETGYGVIPLEIMLITYFVFEYFYSEQCKGYSLKAKPALNVFKNLIKKNALEDINKLFNISSFKLMIIINERLLYYRNKLKKLQDNIENERKSEEKIITELINSVFYVITADENSMQKYTKPFASLTEITKEEIKIRQYNYKTYNELERIYPENIPFIELIIDTCKKTAYYFSDTSLLILKAIQEVQNYIRDTQNNNSEDITKVSYDIKLNIPETGGANDIDISKKNFTSEEIDNSNIETKTNDIDTVENIEKEIHFAQINLIKIGIIMAILLVGIIVLDYKNRKSEYHNYQISNEQNRNNTNEIKYISSNLDSLIFPLFYSYNLEQEKFEGPYNQNNIKNGEYYIKVSEPGGNAAISDVEFYNKYFNQIHDFSMEKCIGHPIFYKGNLYNDVNGEGLYKINVTEQKLACKKLTDEELKELSIITLPVSIESFQNNKTYNVYGYNYYYIIDNDYIVPNIAKGLRPVQELLMEDYVIEYTDYWQNIKIGEIKITAKNND